MSDKVPIEPSDSYASGGLSVGRFSFRMREMVIAMALIVVVVMCFVFIGLFATTPKSSGVSGGGVTQALKGSNSTYYPTGTAPPAPTLSSRFCSSVGCLKGSSYVRGLMNISVDPCEDLYTYACGNWETKHPLLPSQYSSSPNQNLYEANKEKLRQLLDSDVIRKTPWAAERKAKELYASCMDDYGRMVQGGNPFVEKVLSHIGGFWLVQNLTSDWNMLDAVEKIHVDFWTDVLFNVYVGYDYTYSYRYRRPIITISDGGIGMGYYGYYTSNRNNYNETRIAYKKYMRNIAGLLARDAKVASGSALNIKLDTFVNDVMFIETQLANISSQSPYSYTSSGRINLRTLSNVTNNLIDWMSFFKYLFNENYISKYTYVRQTRPQYLTNVANMIQALQAESKNRILNNYFVWQMAMKYSPSLSFEYIYAETEYYNDRFNYGVEPQDPADLCFNNVQRYMDKALSHLFVRDHFSDDSKKKVLDMVSGVKQSLLDRVDKMDFMDQSTKNYAKQKLQAAIDTIGYPDWIMDADEIDLIYYQLNVTKTNFFHNMLSVNVFDKKDWNNRLRRVYGETHPEFRGNTFDRYLSFYMSNELDVPAGLLQDPFYNINNPNYLNYGSIGTMIGHAYIDAINEYGSTYDMGGERILEPGSLYRSRQWWSNSTIHSFNSATKCFDEFYINKTANTYVDDDNKTITVLVTPTEASYYNSQAAQELAGVLTAYGAYQALQKKNGNDTLAPGMDKSNDQMFFLAYAQTKCEVTRPYPHHFFGFFFGFGISYNLRLNGAVAMMDEYSKAFGCKAGATLNPGKKCKAF